MDLPDSSCPDIPEDEVEDEDFQENMELRDGQESEVIVIINAETIIRHIQNCLVPKLAQNYDESERHSEFESRNGSLNIRIKNVIEDLEQYDFQAAPDNEATQSDKPNTMRILSALLNLYKELLSSGSWNSDNAKQCAKEINDCFNMNCKMNLPDILKKNNICDSQAVFDRMLDELCKKLTSNNYKKYPAQVEVYCDLVQNCKKFDVKVSSLKILPVALILMDDYSESNKGKGLKCCRALLENLTPKDFENGNYYDVIYISVKNALNHRDVTITELSQDCALELCRVFPSDVKDQKLDEMYTAALDELGTESNLYRKAALLKYTKKMMEILEIKCVGKSVFKTIICDSIESCLIDSVAEVLLIPSLECLEEWIKYCWPVWKLPIDYKVLCALLKYYSKCNTGEGGLLTQKLIVTLVSLCTPEEQKQFTTQLESKDKSQNNKMDGLKKDIGVNTNLD